MTWDKEGCTGTLFHSAQPNSKFIEICFDIECRIDGTIKMVVTPPKFCQEATWLVDMFHSPSNEGRLLLNGQASDGIDITSYNIYLTQASPQIRQGGEQAVLALEVECTELRVSASLIEQGLNRGNSACIRYDLKGFRCFPAVNMEAEIGEIAASSIATIDNYDEITGAITIETKNLGRKNEWVKRSNEQLELILDVFSLAGGRFLEWSRKSLFLENKWVETVFRSTSHRGKPCFPVFPSMNMQPILELAVTKYNKEIKQTTSFGLALEAFLIPSIYLETQFMTSFMALENFVNTFVYEKKRTKILTDKEFTRFIKTEVKKGLCRAQELMKASNDIKELDVKNIDDSIEAINCKINELNRYPFLQNLRMFLDEIVVPLDGLPIKDINKMVQTRHTIIHSGSTTSPNTMGKQHGLSLLRELLTRIFLTLLKFEGEYSSYLNGYQYVRFPNTEG